MFLYLYTVKQKLLKIVNPILFLIMLIQVVSGFGQRYADIDLYVLFNRIHYPNGILLLIFLIIHLYLLTTGESLRAHLRPMIDGYDSIELTEAEEGYLEEREKLE